MKRGLVQANDKTLDHLARKKLQIVKIMYLR
jgi:hypothetical protein